MPKQTVQIKESNEFNTVQYTSTPLKDSFKFTWAQQLSQANFIKLAQDFLTREPCNACLMSENDGSDDDNPLHITEEGLLIVINNLITDKKSSTDFNTTNTFVVFDDVEDLECDGPFVFTNLIDFFNRFGKLQEGEDLKLIFGITSIYDSMHTISIYLRNNGGRLNVFLLDPTRGVFLQYRSSHSVLAVIREYAKKHKLDYKLIANSTSIQKDHYTCTVFAYLATIFYMKHGKDLFIELASDDMFFSYDSKFDGETDPKVVFLKADKLPVELLKLSQFTQRPNQAIKEVLQPSTGNYWPKVIQGVHYDTSDLYATDSSNPKNKIVGEYRLRNTMDLELLDGRLIKNAMVATLLENQVILGNILDILKTNVCITDDLALDHEAITELTNNLKIQMYQSVYQSSNLTPTIVK